MRNGANILEQSAPGSVFNDETDLFDGRWVSFFCALRRKREEFAMSLWELFVIAVGLSMDAFAVAICKGLSVGKASPRHAIVAGVWFGGFQALMPFLGWLLGTRFQDAITSIDHWIAFILLGLIGGNMIREALSGGEEEEMNTSFSPAAMFPMAVATSIDALAVGITFAFLDVPIGPAVGFIGVVTFVLSAIGVKMGSVLGEKFQSKAEFFGGAVLIIMGFKILLEHLGVIG